VARLAYKREPHAKVVECRRFMNGKNMDIYLAENEEDESKASETIRGGIFVYDAPSRLWVTALSSKSITYGEYSLVC
jgi:hypothetical protein